MQRFLLVIFVGLFAACNSSTGKDKSFSEEEVLIVPQPAKMELKEGYFEFDEHTAFVVKNEVQEKVSALLIDKFSAAAGFTPKLVKDKPGSNLVELKENPGLGEEEYNLSVTNNAVLVEASGFSGYLYALESIRQLLPVAIEKEDVQTSVSWRIPGIEINDEPRYAWRGLMLDVSRHFFEKEYILKTLDRMAMLKLNTFHWHLVDDQGWRIEIKKYPKLTEVGAWRVDQEEKHWNARSKNEPGQEATYGGFYTQEDIREVVEYAKNKGITVVPEIELPAHVMSAIAAYPELSCTGKPIAIPSGGVWPITDIYCPGKETTFEFLENVFLEVMDLFPSRYIHVGGDEATKTEWKTCPHCQQRMKEEGLADVEELQSYFIRRMEQFLSSHDRILIGWDEILEGGLAPGATVMSWRGINGGWEASKEGHDVVMTPESPLYLNMYQGDPDTEPLAQGGYNPIKKVYEFDPVVDSMSVEQKNHVLGAQANLWSEYIPSVSHSEYMLYPRLAAVSEMLWTPEEKKDWKRFSANLEKMLARFDAMGINYSRSAYAVNADVEVNMEEKNLKVYLENELSGSEIRYVKNDNNLDNNARLYDQPFTLDSTTTVKAAVFKNGKIMGDTLEKTFFFHRALGKKVSYEPPFDQRYQGQGPITPVNIIRGSKNFHDGQWVAWLGKEVEILIDLEEKVPVSNVLVGALEDQGSGIYFPTQVEVLVSGNNKDFKKAGAVSRKFDHNPYSSLKDFTVSFEPEEARYIKMKITPYKPERGGAWLFVDEVVVE